MSALPTPAQAAAAPDGVDAARAEPGRAVDRRRRLDRAYVAMLFPALALFTVFITVPALVGMFFSFTNYTGFGDWKFVGLSNYT